MNSPIPHPHTKAIALFNKQTKENTAGDHLWQVARHPFSRHWTTTPFPGFCATLSYRCIKKVNLAVACFSRGQVASQAA